MDILFGAVYLDRLNVKILPAGGVYWRPTPEWDAYLVFPNPEGSQALVRLGQLEHLLVRGGRVRRRLVDGATAAASARIDYNDIRAYGGLEFDTQTKIRGYFEIGYVFDREVLYDESCRQFPRSIRTTRSCSAPESISKA